MTPADFYVRAVIGGNIHLTDKVSQKNEIEPNWQIRQKVKRGKVKIWLELWDKDLQKDDLIDINGRTDRSKRPLEFTIDTRSCRILGFKGKIRCGDRITRAGNEKKKAAITFSLTKK